MFKEDQQFLKVSNDKKKISYVQQYNFDKADNFVEGAGILIKKPYVVLDFDDKEAFKKVVKILDHRGIETPIMKSDRGGHIWFTSDQDFLNKKSFLPILLECDVKSWGITSAGTERKCYVMVKRFGKWREWISPLTTNIAPLPYWLTPNERPFTRSNLLTDFDEGERNNNLYRLQIPLHQAFGFDRHQIKNIIETINDYLLDNPLDQSEIDAMFKGEIVLADQRSFFVGNKFRHDYLAKFIHGSYHVKRYQRELWCYINGEYRRGEMDLRRICREMLPILKNSQLNEVIAYLNDTCDNEDENIIPYIALNNIVLNTDDLTFHQPSPKIFTPFKLDIMLNKDLYNDPHHIEVIEWFESKVLDPILTQDKDLFYEILGYILVPHTNAQKVFFFLGNGSNGKSIILDNVIQPMFKPHTSSLSISDLNKQFSTSELVNSLVNIDSDNSAQSLKETSIFKKIASGDKIRIEEKYKNTFDMRNRAKMIMAFNKLPRTYDNNKGFLRRLTIIKFNTIFSLENGNLNPNLPEELEKNRQIINEYLFIKALQGLSKLRANKWVFTVSAHDGSREYEEDIKPVYKWLRDEELHRKDFDYRIVRHKFNDFKAWHENNIGDDRWLKFFTIKMFSKQVREFYGNKLITVKKYFASEGGTTQTCFKIIE